jgi:hypothetical protein
MEPNELFYCTKCNEPANKIVMVVETEMELNWNEKEQVYEISEYYLNYENTKSVVCAKCINNLIDNKQTKSENNEILTKQLL